MIGYFDFFGDVDKITKKQPKFCPLDPKQLEIERKEAGKKISEELEKLRKAYNWDN